MEFCGTEICRTKTETKMETFMRKRKYNNVFRWNAHENGISSAIELFHFFYAVLSYIIYRTYAVIRNLCTLCYIIMISTYILFQLRNVTILLVCFSLFCIIQGFFFPTNICFCSVFALYSVYICFR